MFLEMSHIKVRSREMRSCAFEGNSPAHMKDSHVLETSAYFNVDAICVLSLCRCGLLQLLAELHTAQYFLCLFAYAAQEDQEVLILLPYLAKLEQHVLL